ncbi:MAG: glyoxalase [Alphaproteobacteria bacterium]|nr:glyoxalase [Alphaproteobacteria bacterium]
MGVKALAYVRIAAREPQRWRDYLTQIVGAMPGTGAPEGVDFFRIDDRPFRFWIEPGEVDAFAAAGWDAGDAANFDATVATLRDAGRTIEMLTSAEAATRCAIRAARSIDPAGNVFEVIEGRGDVVVTPFASPIGVTGFITGALGMGHVVLAAPNFKETHDFYRRTLGFGDSDVPRFKLGPGPDDPDMGFAFMHANGRHHSLALGEMPMPPSRCIHIMLEMKSLDDVGRAYDRMRINKIPVSATLGRHVNDAMTSFYMQTPAGFDLEIGCDGLVIDPATWTATAHQKISEWGHVWAWQAAQEAERA